ncbi:MAG: hypothetical protein A2144_02975 [Chloroflexi bacterium RBG_16_50_9]|nr:MAG: hypothetical protein A2144_02975 [Chloroflexi bacterium RBG_16_50_9]
MAGICSISKFIYRAPGSLDETLRLLKTIGAHARILAGGTDLMIQMKHGQVCPSLVLDVKKVPELNILEWSRQEGLRIGAAVPLSKLVALTALPREFSFLVQACSIIGSMQIRNRGTLGGNICNAAPSADSAPPLLCLGATSIMASSNGSRTIKLDDFFLAPGQTAMEKDELLVEIDVPTPPARSAGCYLRHTVREEMDIAVAGVASFLTLSPQNKKLKEVRIALGAVAPTPRRAHQSEAILSGKSVTQSIIEQAAEKAAEEADPISDLRASAEYRRELVKVLTRRTLRKSCEQLGIKV